MVRENFNIFELRCVKIEARLEHIGCEFFIKLKFGFLKTSFIERRLLGPRVSLSKIRLKLVSDLNVVYLDGRQANFTKLLLDLVLDVKRTIHFHKFNFMKRSQFLRN